MTFGRADDIALQPRLATAPGFVELLSEFNEVLFLVSHPIQRLWDFSHHCQEELQGGCLTSNQAPDQNAQQAAPIYNFAAARTFVAVINDRSL